MKALIVDAGNTRVTCAAWDGDGQQPALVEGSRTRLAPGVPLRELGILDHPTTPSEENAFRDSFRQIHAAAGCPPVVLTSVVPRVAGLLPGGLNLEIVDHTSNLPFTLGVTEPARVGPDRLCNVAAAAAAGLPTALVVDAGTATTFDLLLDGVFVGGMIAPGMALAAQKLGEMASRLRPVPFGPVSWEVGCDTEAAMAAGAWHAGTGGVRTIVEGILTRYGQMPVVVTGGLGVHIEEQDWFLDPHWTLRGAAMLSNR